MDWDTYEPLNAENSIQVDDKFVVLQGDMFGGQPDDPEDNDLYMITHISDDVFAFNYTTSQFEHLPSSVIKGWLRDNRVFRPMLSSHSFTVEGDTGEPVGIRAVGVADQTEKMASEFGNDVFGFAIGIVFEEGMSATEIQEPYENDVYVAHPSFKCFLDEALETLPEEISNRTAVGSDFAKELVRGILQTLEANTRSRPALTMDSDPILINSDRDEMRIEEPDENSRQFIFTEDEEADLVEFHGMK